jgi:hypothetical protein
MSILLRIPFWDGQLLTQEMRTEFIWETGMRGKWYLEGQGEQDIIKMAIKEVGYEDES